MLSVFDNLVESFDLSVYWRKSKDIKIIGYCVGKLSCSFGVLDIWSDFIRCISLEKEVLKNTENNYEN